MGELTGSLGGLGSFCQVLVCLLQAGTWSILAGMVAHPCAPSALQAILQAQNC